MATIGTGIIGMGFMGQTHCRAVQSAQRDGYPVRLVAVCDANPQRRTGVIHPIGNIKSADAPEERLFDPAEVTGYATADELLADDNVSLVHICTHTETHADLAIRALRANKHVIVEKPVSIRSADVKRVAEAARRSGCLCMPAMCMRFWPGWAWLKECVDKEPFGKLKSVTFHRLARHPKWASEFYSDPRRSGGALFDLHIHDADLVRWLLGDPADVVSTGTLDHVTTLYRYPDGPDHVVAEGGWDHSPGFAFRMRYVAVFERATADYDMLRTGQHLMLSHDETQDVINIEAGTGYDGEIRHMLEVLASGGAQPLLASIDEAVGVARMLEAERRSIQTGKPVRLARSPIRPATRRKSARRAPAGGSPAARPAGSIRKKTRTAPKAAGRNKRTLPGLRGGRKASARSGR